MRTGQLDRVVTLQDVGGTTRTPSGGVVKTWETLATVYASRRDTLGSERVESGVEAMTADTVFKVRWRPDVTAATRLLCDGQAWDVLSAAELGRREWLDLTCRKVSL